MPAQLAALTAVESDTPKGSLTVTDKRFAHAPPKLSPRHVPRVRLTRLLDAADAQTLVLHAPAGYGKTSLAVEWLRQRNDVAWFTARPDSGDIGAAVLGVALAASRLVPAAADRVQQRLSVVEEPAQAARTFAEILAEDLADWPQGGILAIDDYQHLAESEAAESLINWLLVLRPTLRLLVATRRRPSWATSRRLLAGEIVELGKRALSMTNDEVAAVLGDGDQRELRELLDKAEGWPAVIGLAALSPAPDLDAAPRIADDLFRYFAEEVLRSMGPEERRLMLVASVPRSITPSLMADLAEEQSLSQLDELRNLGLLTEASDGELRFHPLVREFLLRELRRDNEVRLREIALHLLDRGREEERWEDAFDASLMLGDARVSADIAGDAASDMIRFGRIETLERWLALCGGAADESVSATLARATLLYHAGRFAAARSLALDAEKLAVATGVDSARAVNLAARAASSAGLTKVALALYLRVREEATSRRDRVDAIYGATMAAAELEDERVSMFAEHLDRETSPDQETRLRSFTRWTSIGDRMGTLVKAEELLHTVEPIRDSHADPIALSGAHNAVVHVLCAQARFDEALDAAARGIAYCERFRMPWAADWIRLTLIRGLLGLGKVAEARSRLEQLAPSAVKAEDAAFRTVYERTRIQTALLARRPMPSASLPPASSDHVPAALLGELRVFHALQAALGRDLVAARRLAREAAMMSGAVEAVCYSQLVEALANDLEARLDSPSPELESAAFDACERRLVEAFVTVARHHQPLVTWGRRQSLLADALKRARMLPAGRDRTNESDLDGLAALGLTPREAEVLSLLAEGATNDEIARALVVSLSTIKAHVHSVLKKLDVRNRQEAALVYLTGRGNELPVYAADKSRSDSAG